MPLQDVSDYFIPKGDACNLLEKKKKTASVVSMAGVVLIARPTAIFGSASHSRIPVIPVTDGQLPTSTNPVEKGTQTERMIAVVYVIMSISNFGLFSKMVSKDCPDWSFRCIRSLYVKKKKKKFAMIFLLTNLFVRYDNSCHWKASTSYAFYDFSIIYGDHRVDRRVKSVAHRHRCLGR